MKASAVWLLLVGVVLAANEVARVVVLTELENSLAVSYSDDGTATTTTLVRVSYLSKPVAPLPEYRSSFICQTSDSLIVSNAVAVDVASAYHRLVGQRVAVEVRLP